MRQAEIKQQAERDAMTPRQKKWEKEERLGRQKRLMAIQRKRALAECPLDDPAFCHFARRLWERMRK